MHTSTTKQTNSAIFSLSAFLLGCFFFLLAPSAQAFILVNRTAGREITAKVNGHTYNIPAGGSVLCDYHNDDCTGVADDATARSTQITLQMEAETFVCVLPLMGGGTAYFFEENRYPLLQNAPFGFYCESRDLNNDLIKQVPYGVNAASRDVRFLVTGDPQFDATDDPPCDPYAVAGCDPQDRSDADTVLTTMVNMIKANSQIRGAVVAGDLVHNGQKREFDHYKQEIAGFSRFFFDGAGNHDVSYIDSDSFSICDFLGDKCRRPEYIVGDVASRKRATRQTNSGGKFVIHDPNPLYLVPREVENPHYSWDWHDVHFVQLNLFPGDDPGYYENLDPGASLSFLKQDLETYVGAQGRPVVLIHHYGFDGFSTGADGKKDSNGNLIEAWWTEEQRAAYWNVIKDYNVIAIFTGHAHLTTDAAYDDSWHPQFNQPANSQSRPDGRQFIPSFISGAARGNTDDNHVHQGGVLLDVSITACDTMTVTRMDVNGNPIAGQAQNVPFASPSPVPANCPQIRCKDVTIAADGQCQGTNVSIDDGSTDPLGGSLNCQQQPQGPYGLGDTPVTLSCVSSVNNQASSCTATVHLVDQTPPTVISRQETIECNNGAGGATADIVPQVSDNCSANLLPECSVSHTFPLGFTAGFCQAVDAWNNIAFGYLSVRVVDTTAPAISCPANVWTYPTIPLGAVVPISATATDSCDPAPVVQCPASGSVFGIGATTPVSCTATDHENQQSSCSLTVHVFSLQEMSMALGEYFTAFQEENILNIAQTNNLQFRLQDIHIAIN